MYGLTFKLDSETLDDLGMRESEAYGAIERELRAAGYIHPQYSVYLCTEPRNEMLAITEAIEILKKLEWFRLAVRNLIVFEVAEYSDITDYIQVQGNW